MKVLKRDKNGKLVVEDDASFEESSKRASRVTRPEGATRKDVTRGGIGGAITGALKTSLNPLGNAWDLGKEYLPDNIRENVEDFAGGAEKGVTFGLNTRIRGGLKAAEQAAEKGSLSDLGRDYNKARYEAEQDQVLREQRSPWASGAGEVVGSLIGPSAGAGLAIKGAQALRGGKMLGRAAQFMIGGAGAGAVGGALQGAGQTQDLTDIPEAAGDIGRGALAGSLGGAALGAVAAPISNATRGLRANIGSRVGRALEGKSPIGEKASDAARFATKRMQYERLKENAQRQVMDTLQTGGVTPNMAEAKLAGMRGQGGEGVLADVSRATQGELKALQDRGTRGVEQVADKMETRATRRGGRLRNFISDISDIDSAETAGQVGAAMRKGRLDNGKIDYRVGGPLDSPAVTTPRLQQIADNINIVDDLPDDTVEGIMQRAYKTIKAHPDYPHPFIKIPDPTNPTGEKVLPSMRMWDQVMRGYREKIGDLYKSGKGSMADALKAQMQNLRGELESVNPEWADVLRDQSRGLANEAALDVSTKFGDKIFTQPRQVIAKIFSGHNPEELAAIRRGLLDHVFDKSGSMRALPTKIKTAIDDPNQPEAKQLWDFILGGEDKTAALKKWIDVEHPQAATEAVTGRNSITSFARAAAEELERKEASAMGYAGRAALGAVTKNPAMFAANSATLSQRLADRLSAGAKQSTRTRVLRELTRGRKAGDIEKMAKDLVKAEMTRAQARRAGISRTGRYGGIKAAQWAAPGIGEGPED